MRNPEFFIGSGEQLEYFFKAHSKTSQKADMLAI